MGRPRLSLLLLLAASALAMGAAGCHRDGCVGGDDGQCVPPPACAALVYPTYPTCREPRLRAGQIGPGEAERALGPKALAAEGDYLLENDRVRVVLDAVFNHSGTPASSRTIRIRATSARPPVAMWRQRITLDATRHAATSDALRPFHVRLTMARSW